MFERFTPRARRAIVLAQDAARDMGHPQIQPEHLLVGLDEGEGKAALALRRAGVDAAALRQRVAARHLSTPSAREVDKVPFSKEGKKSLEQSLRAALELGHHYIGTEHLFFGVQRQLERDGELLDDLLGVPAADVQRQLREMLGGPRASSRSPALEDAVERARSGAGRSPMTTGHLLAAMLADANSQASRALAALGLDESRVAGAVQAVPLAETSDASSPAQTVSITIGDTTTVVADPEVAAALQNLSADQLRALIRRVVDAQS